MPRKGRSRVWSRKRVCAVFSRPMCTRGSRCTRACSPSLSLGLLFVGVRLVEDTNPGVFGPSGFVGVNFRGGAITRWPFSASGGLADRSHGPHSISGRCRRRWRWRSVSYGGRVPRPCRHGPRRRTLSVEVDERRLPRPRAQRRAAQRGRPTTAVPMSARRAYRWMCWASSSSPTHRPLATRFSAIERSEPRLSRTMASLGSGAASWASMVAMSAATCAR